LPKLAVRLSPQRELLSFIPSNDVALLNSVQSREERQQREYQREDVICHIIRNKSLMKRVNLIPIESGEIPYLTEPGTLSSEP
jgi:hypothetical protein